MTLSGVVHSAEARRAAETAARKTPGVTRVDNRLVAAPPREGRSIIAEDVEQALALEPSIERRRINVLLEDGVATLSGTVGTRSEKERAEDVAARVAGVARVVNRLSVDRP